MTPQTPTAEKGLNAFFKAVNSGDAQAVARMIQDGFDVEATDEAGFTALQGAAVHGDVGVIDALVRAGAKLDKATQCQFAPPALLCAAWFQNVDAVHTLLRAGADPNTTCEQGANALHYTARAYSKEGENIIQALLTAGTRTGTKDKDGQTPEEVARSYGNDTAAALLAASERRARVPPVAPQEQKRRRARL